MITIGFGCSRRKRLFFLIFGTNNYQAGVIVGSRPANDLKGKGNVIAFSIPEQQGERRAATATHLQRIHKLDHSCRRDIKVDLLLL